MSAGARVDVLTFGCRLNIVESDAMRRHALAAGHRDLTIVNTCAVTAEAARQARQAIRRVRREHPSGRLVVTGCASEIERGAFAALPGVDAVLPNAEKTAPASWPALAGAAGETGHSPRLSTDFSPSVAGGHTRGFVEIQNGCDHRCTFCVIPFGRGVSRSVPTAQVVARVRALVEGGARDVVLTGVDLTSYGADLDGRPTLGVLVRHLLKAIPDLPRLRLSSLDCIETDPDLREAIATEPRLMPHLHLSLQAGSNLILKRMKRRHTREDAIDFCEDLRRLRPDIVFGADLIAGFPTETEAMHEETADLIAACGLTHVHVFPFSPRPGTPAARMPQVSGPVVKERAARLRTLAAARLDRHLTGMVGRTLPVLTEQGGKGRTADFTLVRLEADPPPGLFIPLTMTAHDGRALRGACESGHAIGC